MKNIYLVNKQVAVGVCSFAPTPIMGFTYSQDADTYIADVVQDGKSQLTVSTISLFTDLHDLRINGVNGIREKALAKLTAEEKFALGLGV